MCLNIFQCAWTFWSTKLDAENQNAIDGVKGRSQVRHKHWKLSLTMYLIMFSLEMNLCRVWRGWLHPPYCTHNVSFPPLNCLHPNLTIFYQNTMCLQNVQFWRLAWNFSTQVKFVSTGTAGVLLTNITWHWGLEIAILCCHTGCSCWTFSPWHCVWIS